MFYEGCSVLSVGHIREGVAGCFEEVSSLLREDIVGSLDGSYALVCTDYYSLLLWIDDVLVDLATDAS